MWNDSIPGWIIGTVSGIILGIVFVYGVPLIEPTKYLSFWLLLTIGAVVSNFWLSGFATEHPYPYAEDHVMILNDIKLSLWVTSITFGLEGTIIAFRYAGSLWGVIGLVTWIIGFIITFFQHASGDLWITIGVLITVPSFILGLIFGGSLAYIALILFISALITAVIADILWIYYGRKS
jgi:hypothetical protein